MLLLVDGTNLGCRAYHALKNTRDGIPVSKTGLPIASASVVLKSLPTLIRQSRATHVAVAFDNGDPTFRHTLYPDYKNKGSEKDALLKQDLQQLQQALLALGIGIVAPPNYEADDLIATLIETIADESIIYSSDRDLLQLVTSKVSVLYPGAQNGLMTPDLIRIKMGVLPHQVADYKALAGDASDCIPGVQGIGPKRASELLNRYSSVEDIYTNLGKITGTLYTKLRAGKEDAALYKQITVLVRDAPLPENVLHRFALRNLNLEAFVASLKPLGLADLSENYNFRNL